jgi:hypothetical protein
MTGRTSVMKDKAAINKETPIKVDHETSYCKFNPPSDSFDMSPTKMTPSPMLDRIPSDKKRGLAANISMAYNKSLNKSLKNRTAMKASLTKSLVEDASEDFSNIEEHISSMQNQQIELQAEKILT